MSTTKKTIGWGKPTIYYRKTTETNFKKAPDIAEGTTQVNSSIGDKLEAKVEGGEVEAVKYKAGTSELVYGYRVAAETTRHIPHVNGIVADEYAIVVVPENESAPGLYIEASSVTVEDSFSADDGFFVTYSHASIAGTSGSALKYGVMTVTSLTGANAGQYTISAKGWDFDSDTALQGPAQQTQGSS